MFNQKNIIHHLTLIAHHSRLSSGELISSQNYPRRNDNKLRFRTVVPKVWSSMSNIEDHIKTCLKCNFADIYLTGNSGGRTQE